MSICATRGHYQPQNMAENDIKLSNFCQKATKAPEDVKRIEIDRTDRWTNLCKVVRDFPQKSNCE